VSSEGLDKLELLKYWTDETEDSECTVIRNEEREVAQAISISIIPYILWVFAACSLIFYMV
jgi:hypothetical protein